MKRMLLAILTACSMMPLGASTEELPNGLPADAVASVGGEVVRFSQLNTLLNSAPVVGLSIPALGTTERNQVMVDLLDKAITVNLLYLDAIAQGKDRVPPYTDELQAFSDGIIAGLYRAKHLVGDVSVTPEEVDTFYKEQIVAGTEMTDKLRAGIEARIRKDKFKGRTATMRERLRAGLDVTVYEANLDITGDDQRKDSALVAEFVGRAITWGEVKDSMKTPIHTYALEKRLETINRLVDQRLMAMKGREAGLDKDPMFKIRVGEFSKTRLVNLHRGDIVRSMEPSDEELRAYYDANRDAIEVRERRKIQMVVLASEAEAKDVKARLDSGEITIYQAAADHSIHPRAKHNLGDFGWVSKGTGFPGLGELVFNLGPGELGGPIESPAGWHLVLVTDTRDGRFSDIGDEDTRNVTRRRLMKQRLNEYVVGLRKNRFPVTVYQDNINRIFREEAQWIAAKTEEMNKHPEREKELLDKMRGMVE